MLTESTDKFLLDDMSRDDDPVGVLGVVRDFPGVVRLFRGGVCDFGGVFGAC